MAGLRKARRRWLRGSSATPSVSIRGGDAENRVHALAAPKTLVLPALQALVAAAGNRQDFFAT